MKLFALAVMVGAVVLAGCSQSEAERKHQAELKKIRSRTTTKETQQFVESTRKLLGGFGPVSTPEKARECVAQRLSDWRRGELAYSGVRPPELLFAKLLDFKVVDASAKETYYLVTVNLKVELSGGSATTGGGDTANRQIQHKITKDTGIITLVD